MRRERRLAIDWYFQWMEWPLISRYNWLNFDFCHIGFEYTKYHRRGEWEFVFIILGVGFRLTTWLTGESLITELEERAKIIISELDKTTNNKGGE